MRQEDTWLLSLQSQYRITKRSAVLYDKIWHNDSEKSKKTIIKDSDNKKSSLWDTKLWTAISYAILSEQTRQLWFILECLTTVSKAIENKLAWYLREYQVETGRILNQRFFEDFRRKKPWTGYLFVTQMVSKEKPTMCHNFWLGIYFKELHHNETLSQGQNVCILVHPNIVASLCGYRTSWLFGSSAFWKLKVISSTKWNWQFLWKAMFLAALF